MPNISKLNGGYEITLDEGQEVVCHDCKKKLKTPFYWCEQNKCMYCNACMLEHHVIRNHIDWHIIKIS